jgi:nondiscriminating glutamyl-tRNA synthetase
MKDKVRVRIAPSPTGFFHVGSARTALYNWLFARHHGGKFILRVEDTDIARSSEGMISVILDGLKWLGINWDEGPFFQSQRLSLYQKYIQSLLEQGKAYFCYCDPGDLEREKQTAYKRKQDWQYDRRCLQLSPAERAEKERKNIPRVVRFLVPDGPVTFHDIVHHEIKREAQDIEDLVIMRSNGIPTYNLACVVDDYEMGISHVIRAVDHITNTPKQILLYNALGLPLPEYAHLPLILGEDRSKMSKRHGAASLMIYKEKGYIPGAVLNYLALLGWSPGEDREIMSADDIISSFDLSHINPSNAVFDEQKLEWMNGQYIYAMSDTELYEQLRPFVLDSGLLDDHTIKDMKDYLMKVIGLTKLRLKTLADFKEVAGYFFVDDFAYEEGGLAKHYNESTIGVMGAFSGHFEKIEEYSAQAIEESVRSFADSNRLKARQIIHPLRLAVTGKQGGPGLFETMEVIGKERCLLRIRRFIDGFKGSKEDKKQ